MAAACAAPAGRQPIASCSGRGLLPACCRRPPLPPPAARRLPATARRAARCVAAADDDAGAGQQEEREWGQSVKLFDFNYMSAEEVAAAEAAAEAAWQAGMDEYAELQEWLLFRTWRFGLLFAGYLLLAASAEAAFCELVGSAAGYGYLKWLIADVSRLQPGDRVAMREAERVQPVLARWASKLAAGYRQALQPRLLVLPGLVAGVAAWNAAFPEQQLGLVELGCLVAGFLSYKVALALKIYQDLRPKPLTEKDILQEQRPMLVEVEDVSIDLRAIGRKKAAAEAAEAAAAAADVGAAEEAAAEVRPQQVQAQAQQQQQEQQQSQRGAQ